jgi:hypothetical protein
MLRSPRRYLATTAYSYVFFVLKRLFKKHVKVYLHLHLELLIVCNLREVGWSSHLDVQTAHEEGGEVWKFRARVNGTEVPYAYKERW